MKRLESPDRRRYVSYFIDVAEDYLKSVGRSEMLRANPFLCAFFAHGDIPISGVGRSHEGIQVEIGLAEHVGRSADRAWRKLLESAQPPREAPIERPPAPRSISQVQVVRPSVY